MNVDNDSLISYVLGQLPPEEEAMVEMYLRTHPEDAATVVAYLDSLADMVMALPPEPLAKGNEAALLARVRGTKTNLPPVMIFPARPEPERSKPKRSKAKHSEPRRRNAARYGWLGALAAAAVVAVLYFTVFVPLNQNTQSVSALQQYKAQPGAVSYALRQEGQAEPLGTLVRLREGRVFVALDEPPPAEQVYQAWEIGQAPVSLGTFGGRTFLSNTPVSKNNTFGLTLEPPGGSKQPTSAPITLVEL